MAKRGNTFTVSGPDLDVGYEEPGPALSRAITEAARLRRVVTVYVRDRNGDPVGYAESDERGEIIVVRHKEAR